MATDLMSVGDFNHLKKRALQLAIAITKQQSQEQQPAVVEFFEGVRLLSTYKFFHPRVIEDLSKVIFEDQHRHELLTECVLSLSTAFLTECIIQSSSLDSIIKTIVYGRVLITELDKKEEWPSSMPENLFSLVTVQPNFIEQVIRSNPWILVLYFYHLSLLEQ